MEKNLHQSNYYNDIEIFKLPCDDTEVLSFVESVKCDIICENTKNSEKAYRWYDEWHKKDIEYTLLAYAKGTPVSFSSYKSDGKILCYLYTITEYRNKYRELAQIDYIPLHVQYTDLPKLYLSIDAFDKTHERLAKVWDRKLISGIPEEYTPYRGKFKYVGVQNIKNTEQHVYELELK